MEDTKDQVPRDHGGGLAPRPLRARGAEDLIKERAVQNPQNRFAAFSIVAGR